ncbi:hypothetical protein VI817_002299 [Penicillium citrinum]|nr:hypothetical protein VI817_002299 [Penicillium citrinum]
MRKETEEQWKRESMGRHFSASVNFPLGLGDSHKEFNIFYRNPAGENFHYVLKIGFQNYITHAIYKSSGCGMEYVKTLTKGPWVFRRAFPRRGSWSTCMVF